MIALIVWNLLTMMFYHKYNEGLLFYFTLSPLIRGQNLVATCNLLYHKLCWS